MLKALFWDIDGTLLDTECLHALQFVEICKGKDLEIEIDALAGASNYDMWHSLKLYEIFDNYEKWLELISQGYDEQVSAALVREGISEVLAYFQKKGLQQIAVSNGTRHVVDINLGNTDLLRFFEHSISNDDVTRGKPDSEPYRKAIQYCNISPKEGIAIEDTPIGLQAAKAAGLLTVAFPTEQTKTMDLNRADFIIGHPQELIGIVESLGNRK